MSIRWTLRSNASRGKDRDESFDSTLENKMHELNLDAISAFFIFLFSGVHTVHFPVWIWFSTRWSCASFSSLLCVYKEELRSCLCRRKWYEIWNDNALSWHGFDDGSIIHIMTKRTVWPQLCRNSIYLCLFRNANASSKNEQFLKCELSLTPRLKFGPKRPKQKRLTAQIGHDNTLNHKAQLIEWR